jgi:vitamin B12 transporter
VTVITAKEIEALNAHTLGEVLNTIPSVHVEPRVTPGGFSPNISIQGSESNHVRVVMDGVTINNVSDFLADVGAMPVQRIALIEIIKGPASSAWGSSLGGIINIITKSPDEARKSGGLVSASVGDRTTSDFRLELSGTRSPLGYYLVADGITSDGLQPHTNVDSGNVYGKLAWEPRDETRLFATYGYSRGKRGLGEFPQFGLLNDGDFEHLIATLGMTHALSDSLDLDISGRFSRRDFSASFRELGTLLEVDKSSFKQPNLGASVKLAWRAGIHSITTGADYDNGTMAADQKSLAVGPVSGDTLAISTKRDGRLERWALFANDTMVWNGWSLTPGLRYDWTSTSSDFLSPSIGVTYNWNDHTILRTYVARGFNIPFLTATNGAGQGLQPNPNLKVEKVWSYQVGFETTLLKYLWLKSTLFRHDVSDFLAFDAATGGYANQGKQRRQGVEVEAKTIPIFNTTVSAGYTFIDANGPFTDAGGLLSSGRVPNIPPHTLDTALHYDDRKLLRGGIVGRYTWWNAREDFNGRYTTMIWDFNLGLQLLTSDRLSGEIFLVAHNLFNGSQYLNELAKNPRRWFEGGLRFKF